MPQTKLLTVLTKKAMIFSKMVDEIHTKFFEMHVKYRVALKTVLQWKKAFILVIYCQLAKTVTKLAIVLTCFLQNSREIHTK